MMLFQLTEGYKTIINRFLLYTVVIILGNALGYCIVHIPKQFEMMIFFSMLIAYPIIKKPTIGLYLIFTFSAFIPFLRRLYYLAYERPSVDPLIALDVVFLILLILGLFFKIKELFNFPSAVNKYIYLLLFYVAYLLFRCFVFNFLPFEQALTRFKFYGPSVFLFIIGVIYASNSKLIQRIWYVTIIIGIIAALYGLYQLYFGYNAAEKIWFSSIEFTTLFMGGIPRPFSLFQAPVVLADYMHLTIISICMAFGWMKRKSKIILLFMIPILFYSALTTSVRSSWIGIITCLLLWIFLSITHSNKQRIIALVVLFILSIFSQIIIDILSISIKAATLLPQLDNGSKAAYYYNLFISERMQAILDPMKEYSFLSRLSLWQEIIILSADPIHAILGRGVGTLNADSLYFTYLAELGYPGFVFICALLFVFVFKAAQLLTKTHDSFEKILIQGILIIDITFAFISITGSHIHYFPGDVYFWFFNGVLIQRSYHFNESAVTS